MLYQTNSPESPRAKYPLETNVFQITIVLEAVWQLLQLPYHWDHTAKSSSAALIVQEDPLSHRLFMGSGIPSNQT